MRISNGDHVRFLTGVQNEISPLPSNTWVEGIVTDSGLCVRYPRNPTIHTRFGSVEVLRSKVEKVG